MSERDRLGRQDHSLIFKTGVVMSQWLPSHRVINLNCVKSSKYQPGRYSPAPNAFRERSSLQKEAIADPAKANSRTGVPSRGAEDIGRGSAVSMVAWRRLRVSYAQRH